MTRTEPHMVVFWCEVCDEDCKSSPKLARQRLRKSRIGKQGVCLECGGCHWTLHVFYVEERPDLDNYPNLFEELAVKTITNAPQAEMPPVSVSSSIYPSVPGEVVAVLNEVPEDLLYRVAQFVTEMERESLRQLGGRECLECGILFVQAANKPWTTIGYCSKSCAGKHGHVEMQADAPAESTSRALRHVSVQCGCGHSFEVSTSFRGLKRKCPECNAKVLVPLN